MSHRIGLRHMARIGKSPCPSGEQITNGGFETSDLTGWTSAGSASASTQYARTGSYSCFLYQGWIQQDFSTPIPVICVSSLKFYVESPDQGPGVAGSVTVHYTDNTETVIDIECFADWHEYNITDQLESGKSIDYIKFIGGTLFPYWLDDGSLVC